MFMCMRSDSSITQLVRKGTQISCLTSKSCIFEQLTELDDGDELGASEIDDGDELGVSDTAVNL